MANTNRRLPDKGNKMFIPRNVDGGISDDHFLTGPKLFVLGISSVVAGYFIVVAYTGMNLLFATLSTLIILYLYLLVIRYFVLSEKYYYSMYKRMKEIDITTPAIFWSIVNKHETDDGCVVTFNDMKMGVFIKLDRDSIVGREDNFREQHFDAISDFYAELARNGLHFVKADIMEPAGKDNRIQELDDLVMKANSNPNLYKLMNLQVAHIKNITRATLYESEYYLIYSEKLERVDYLLDTVVETAHILLYGGYCGFTVLDGPEIDELAKQIFGVRIFDSNEATIQVFKNNVNNTNAFTIKTVNYKDGTIKQMVETPPVQKTPIHHKKENKRKHIFTKSFKALPQPTEDTFTDEEPLEAVQPTETNTTDETDNADWSEFNSLIKSDNTYTEHVDITHDTNAQSTNSKEDTISSDGDEFIDL